MGDSPLWESSQPQQDASGSGRGKDGCITCRLRKKRCDKRKPSCETCQRLGIDCLGYGHKRPKWLRENDNTKRARTNMHRQIHRHRRAREPYATLADGNQDLSAAHNYSSTTGPETSSELVRQDGIINVQDNEDDLVWSDTGVTNSIGGSEFELALSSPQHTFPDTSASKTFNGSFDSQFDADFPLMSPISGVQFDPFSLRTAWSPTLQSNKPTETSHFLLRHYMNVVVAMQYRLAATSVGDFIFPLALNFPEVLTSISSLSFLHLAAKRGRAPIAMSGDEWETSDDHDSTMAITSHKMSTERLKFLSSQDLTKQDILVSAIFAVSFHLFRGAVSKNWTSSVETARRCIAAVLTYPEDAGTQSPLGSFRQSPLMSIMISIDILASITQNRVTRLLPIYRRILRRTPRDIKLSASSSLMEESVNLAEWKDHSQQMGCLSMKELMQRAAAIEKLLEERAWRESLLDERDLALGNEEHPTSKTDDVGRTISDIFYYASTLYLATLVNGPFPRVPEVAAAVQDVISALSLLDIIYPDPDINRSLVFPITLSACHCETKQQKDFFRARFKTLAPEAAAFGNSRQALMLMEEVWRRRALGDGSDRVCWRETMKDIWESGILLA